MIITDMAPFLVLKGLGRFNICVIDCVRFFIFSLLLERKVSQAKEDARQCCRGLFYWLSFRIVKYWLHWFKILWTMNAHNSMFEWERGREKNWVPWRLLKLPISDTGCYFLWRRAADRFFTTEPPGKLQCTETGA